MAAFGFGGPVAPGSFLCPALEEEGSGLFCVVPVFGVAAPPGVAAPSLFCTGVAPASLPLLLPFSFLLPSTSFPFPPPNGVPPGATTGVPPTDLSLGTRSTLGVGGAGAAGSTVTGTAGGSDTEFLRRFLVDSGSIASA